MTYSIFAKHGDKIPIPTMPTKADHFFDGWYTEKEYITEWAFEEATVFGDMVLYAKWSSL